MGLGRDMHSIQCHASFKVIEGVVVQAVFVHDLIFFFFNMRVL